MMVAVEQSLRKKDRILIMVQRMVRWWAILMMVAVVRSLRKKDRTLMMASMSSVV